MTARAPALPPGRPLDLPGRGRPFVRHHPAPAGAPTLLLLHGHGITADINWFSAYPALAERYGIVALDHRGHGRGIRSRAPFTLADCADDAAAALTELGVEQVVAVGFSMGGPVAQLFWRRHRARTSGLVLCASVHSYLGAEPVRGRAPALASRLRAVRVARALRSVVEPDLRRWLLAELWRNDQRLTHQAAVSMSRFDSTAWIGELDVPHAVVLTELDAAASPERQRLLVDALPAPSVHPCQAGHSDCLTYDNAFVPALLDALDVVTARASG